ncbi:MAG: amidohydrolase family protein [Bryobacteraceae bacterium]|nr:amidohydrolase family protein [Bryobacteraceae bacterium]
MRSLLLLPLLLTAQTLPEHGRRPARLVVRNALVIEGNGTPASGPRDIFVEGDTITQILPSRAASANQPAGTAVIDAGGRYVIPGLINAHGHIQDERAGLKMAPEYQLKLWLASGITTVRDLGSDFAKSAALRDQSRLGQVAAPRFFLYRVFSQPPMPNTPEEARERIRLYKREGADGREIL